MAIRFDILSAVVSRGRSVISPKLNDPDSEVERGLGVDLLDEPLCLLLGLEGEVGVVGAPLHEVSVPPPLDQLQVQQRTDLPIDEEIPKPTLCEVKWDPLEDETHRGAATELSIHLISFLKINITRNWRCPRTG